MGTDGLIYEVECNYCGRKFPVSDAKAYIPKHLPEGELIEPVRQSELCRGSGLIASPILRPRET